MLEPLQQTFPRLTITMRSTTEYCTVKIVFRILFLMFHPGLHSLLSIQLLISEESLKKVEIYFGADKNEKGKRRSNYN